jgi:hypothetical protein
MVSPRRMAQRLLQKLPMPRRKAAAVHLRQRHQPLPLRSRRLIRLQLRQLLNRHQQHQQPS